MLVLVELKQALLERHQRHLCPATQVEQFVKLGHRSILEGDGQAVGDGDGDGERDTDGDGEADGLAEGEGEGEPGDADGVGVTSGVGSRAQSLPSQTQ